MKINVVIGTTGEYSDRTEWLVKAFTSSKAAQELVVNATRRANEIHVTRPDKYTLPKGLTNKYDPDMQMDYTGTTYYFKDVEFEEERNEY